MTDGRKRSRTEEAIHPTQGTDREYVVPILLKAAHILEIFSEVEEDMSIADIKGACGYSRSTIYRIVRTLVVCGYLTNVDNHKYRSTGLRCEVRHGRTLGIFRIKNNSRIFSHSVLRR